MLEPSKAQVSTVAYNRNSVAPRDDGGSYLAMIKCAGCDLTVQAAGIWGVEPDWNDAGEQRWEIMYRPRWMSHVPSLVEVPEATPAEVQHGLARADALFWSDLAACVTALRQVLEVFLDAQGISRLKQTKKGGQSFRGLEERIKEFAEALKNKDPLEADRYLQFLQATRIISNSVTHEADGVTTKDVMLLAQFIERVLEKRYSGDRLLDEAVRVITSHNTKRQAQSPSQPKATRKTKNASGGQSQQS